MLSEKAILVGHRGDATNYLENTLPAFSGAAKLGLSHIELDVQVTTDGVPIVLHDANLKRTHGLNLDVRKHTFGDLSRHGIFDATRFAYPVPRLEDFVEWMQKKPYMHVFVEIKKESLHTQGRECVLKVITDKLVSLVGRYTLISYDARILAMAKRAGQPIGYVLPTMGSRYRTIAERLAPDLLFGEDHHILRARKLWPGSWNWATFEVEDMAAAQRLTKLGVRYIETMNPALFTG
ncbi:MAG: glycerophosphodiester phosphodiesterase family protein [Gammaproteobacteria bacterium]